MTWPIAIAVGLGLPLGLWALFFAWSRPVVLLALVVASRLLLDSFWQITYQPIVGSFSIVKLYSAAVILFMGFYLWQQRRLDLKPIGLMVLIIIGSAIPGTVLTDRWGGFINVSFRWLLPWLFAMLTLYAIERTSQKQVAWTLLLTLSYVLLNQALGSAIYGAKITGLSASYVGTFEHESLLSALLHGFVALAIGLYGVTRATVIRTVLVLAILAGMAGMYLANYRTSILGLMVSLTFILACIFPRLGIAAKVNMLLFGGIAFGALVVTFGTEFAGKFNDVRVLLDDPGRYFDFSDTGAYAYSEDRTAEGHRLLSGRVELFNSYIAYWVQAPLMQKVFGLGPEFGTDAIGWIAHNEFVSSFVEQGVVGLIVLLGVIISAVLVMRKALRGGDMLSISCAALLVGFLVTTLASMTFRETRALIVMGIMLGFLEAQRRQLRRAERAPVDERGPQANRAVYSPT